jgi:hypothetical protein
LVIVGFWGICWRFGQGTLLREHGAAAATVGWEDFGLAAENAEIADSLVDSLHRREMLMTILRKGFTMGIGLEDHDGVEVGPPRPHGEPFPLPKPAVGNYLLSRGGKRYEQARDTQLAKKALNTLGDVLAVVSDLKLGRETGTPDWIAEYYEGDVVRMQDEQARPTQIGRGLDGMEMPGRGYVSEEYPFYLAQGRLYGYHGQEKENA